MIHIDIGCGNASVANAVTIDIRDSVRPTIQADARHLPIRTSSIDTVHCYQLLEHFKNPYIPLFEIHRVVKSNGRVIISVPNCGTYSDLCDPDHKFSSDLNHWNQIFRGFFESVIAEPYGVRFESVSSKWIKKQQQLIKDGFWDLAQGFKFLCKKKLKEYNIIYIPSFLEEEICQMETKY